MHSRNAFQLRLLQSASSRRTNTGPKDSPGNCARVRSQLLLEFLHLMAKGSRMPRCVIIELNHSHFAQLGFSHGHCKWDKLRKCPTSSFRSRTMLPQALKVLAIFFSFDKER